MNRAARRALVSASERRPAYGRPADLFRQLAALGVVVSVVKSPGHTRLDYRIQDGRVDELRAIQAAFPSDLEWETEVAATFLVVAGMSVGDLPLGSSPDVELSAVLAAPPQDKVARRLLAIGVRQ